MAALYDGDDNRVFTASRTEDTTAYQLFKRQEKKGKGASKSTSTTRSGQDSRKSPKLVQMERKTPFLVWFY